MRFSTIGKAWFGYLFARAAIEVAQEETERWRRVRHRHGYTFVQIEHILTMCYSARPDIRDELNRLEKPELVRKIDGIFAIAPPKFREIFGFDRPAPAVT